jgi:hypothetical protein
MKIDWPVLGLLLNDRRQKSLKDMALARTTDIDTTLRRKHAKTSLVRTVNSLTDSDDKHIRIFIVSILH